MQMEAQSTRRLRGRATHVIRTVVTAVALLTVDSTLLAQQRYVVDDPRPLGAAALQIESECHCIITYEDPQW
jgi:hypothetical protein